MMMRSEIIEEIAISAEEKPIFMSWVMEKNKNGRYESQIMKSK